MVTKPRILRPGDKIGVVAPGGRFRLEAFRHGIKYLKSLGLVPVVGRHVFEKDFIYTSSLKNRLDDLYGMLTRSDISAVWCVRAGYGVYAVAEELAKRPIPHLPKILLGMSDVTALHNLVVQKWGWPCLHSPLLDRLIRSPQRELHVLHESLFNQKYRLTIGHGLKAYGKKASVTAPMVGGNLVLLTTSIGTRWEINPRGKILFIEEIGERAYRLDRFFWQLKNAGKLDGVKGVVLGDFTDCQEPDGKNLWRESLNRVFAKAPYPVIAGVKSGHGDLRLTLPLGAKVNLNTKTSKPVFSVVENYATP